MKRIKIGKKFSFSAAHQIPDLPPEHPCSRLHGHNYEVWVEVEGPLLGSPAWIMDFGELKEVVREVLAPLDHSVLPEWLATAESLALYLFEEIEGKLRHPGVHVARVKVFETETSYAEVTAHARD